MKALKWWGTSLCLLGILLTSLNIYPANILISFVGSTMWAIAGYALDDTPLFVVEAVAVVFYAGGLVMYIATELAKWGVW